MSSATLGKLSASTADGDENPPSGVHSSPGDTSAHRPPQTRNPLQLPPIRTVLGDELALPTPSSHSPPSAYSAGSHGSVREGEGRWSKGEGSTGSDGSSASSLGRHPGPGETHQHHHQYSQGSQLSLPASPSRPAPALDASRLPHTFLSLPARPHTPAAPPHTHSLPPSPFPLHSSTTRYTPLLPPRWPPSPLPALTRPSGPTTPFHPSGLSPHIAPLQPTSFSDVAPFPTVPSSPFPFPPATPHTAPPYLHVLRPSPSGELITGLSIPRVRSRPGTSGAVKDGERGKDAKEGGPHGEDVMSTRRHVCQLCKKRFNRPSSLKVHQSVHTGSRPFLCTYKGCSKTFSVASNMRRHFRKHDAAPGPEQHPQQSGSYSHSPGYSPERAQESMGSSEGEGDGEGDNMDIETEEEQLRPLHSASTSASASSSGGLRSPAVPAALVPPAPAPFPTGLPAPGTYFEWTAAPDVHHDGGEDASIPTAYEAVGARGVYGPAQTRFRTGSGAGRSGSGSGSGSGGRTGSDKHPRHSSH